MSVIALVLVIAALWLAYSNGANDNFKGVATLYGSGTAGFRGALWWATGATLAGSLLSVLLAGGLIATFSGKGLIPDEILGAGALASVGLAAAATIFLATVLGMPTSTTHALTGALVGVGLAAAPGEISWATAGKSFAVPLMLSPVLALGLTAGVYPALSWMRRRAGVSSEMCLCAGRSAPVPVKLTGDGCAMVSDESGGLIEVSVGTDAVCAERYRGAFVGVDAQQAVNGLHWISGGSVCFARALNDTPKIAALLLAGGAVSGGAGGLPGTWVMLAVTVAVVAGGLLQSRRVAETMSKKITDLNTGQGLTANLITAGLVLGASRLGVPVSTTHVSCGSIFGIGAVNGRLRWKIVGEILLTWLTTLPMGLGLGALLYWVMG